MGDSVRFIYYSFRESTMLFSLTLYFVKNLRIEQIIIIKNRKKDNSNTLFTSAKVDASLNGHVQSYFSCKKTRCQKKYRFE